jgi:hypothetical protein
VHEKAAKFIPCYPLLMNDVLFVNISVYPTAEIIDPDYMCRFSVSVRVTDNETWLTGTPAFLFSSPRGIAFSFDKSYDEEVSDFHDKTIRTNSTPVL